MAFPGFSWSSICFFKSWSPYKISHMFVETANQRDIHNLVFPPAIYDSLDARSWCSNAASDSLHDRDAETEPEDKHWHHHLPDPHLRSASRAPEHHQQWARQAQVQLWLCLCWHRHVWNLQEEGVWRPILDIGAGLELRNPQPATLASPDSGSPASVPGCQNCLPAIWWFARSLMPWLFVLPRHCPHHWKGQRVCWKYVLPQYNSMHINCSKLRSMYLTCWVLPFFQSTGIAGGLFPVFSPTLNVTDYLDALSRIVVVSSFAQLSFFSCKLHGFFCCAYGSTGCVDLSQGSDTIPWYTQLVEPAFSSSDTLYLLQPQCVPYLSQTISYNARGIPLQLSKLKLPSLRYLIYYYKKRYWIYSFVLGNLN